MGYLRILFSCCNTFAQFPDQCLSKAIERGLNLFDLKEGICSVAENMEGCASQVSSTVLLQLMSEQPGTIHQLGKRVGLSHMEIDYPALHEAQNSLREITFEALKKHYPGTEAPPPFPEGR